MVSPGAGTDCSFLSVLERVPRTPLAGQAWPAPVVAVQQPARAADSTAWGQGGRGAVPEVREQGTVLGGEARCADQGPDTNGALKGRVQLELCLE